MMQNLKKTLCVDPDIKANIVLDHNRVQIVHLTEEDFLEYFT